MVAPIKFISTLLLATAGSAHALRLSNNSLAMTAGGNDDPAEGVAVAEEAMKALTQRDHMQFEMQAYAIVAPSEITDAVCTQAPEPEECRLKVGAYVNRCGDFDCLTLDVVNYPKRREYQPLVLPDPYQLEAAFYILRNCDSNPLKQEAKKQWAAFRGDGKYDEYRTFLLNLTLANKQFYQFTENVYDLDSFVRSYVYMATLYFKVYTLLDVKQARLMNKVALAHHLFGGKIKKALVTYIKKNLPEDFGKYNVARIKHIMDGYADYMETQVPALPAFARKFAGLVTKTLVKSVTDFQKLPWYRRLYRLLEAFYKKNVHYPTAEFFTKTIGTPLKGFATGTKHRFRKAGEATKATFQKFGEDTKAGFQRFGTDTADKFQKINEATKAKFQRFGEATKAGFQKFGEATKAGFNKLGNVGNDGLQGLGDNEGDAQEVEGEGEAAEGEVPDAQPAEAEAQPAEAEAPPAEAEAPEGATE
uniref:Rhoptry association protein n=1 Tax=Babesia gibsoni TaxID=33632 RepID=B2MVP9_BABGI|nr:rhoptry association protein [Babesia gibsoni]